MPQMKVRLTRAYDIMIMLTWSDSSGEFRTGIMWVICGSICDMWLTNRKKPESRNPKVRRRELRVESGE